MEVFLFEQKSGCGVMQHVNMDDGQTGVADVTWVETGVDRQRSVRQECHWSVYESNVECSLASFDKRHP
jgi:hypothetical protein